MKKSIFFVLSSFVIVLATASTNMTIAWFNTNDKLHVEGIDISFDSYSDLLISTKNEIDTFKQHINYEELKKVKFFEPVSAMKSADWIKEKAKNPTFYEGFDQYNNIIETKNFVTYVRPNEVIASEGFYSQELFLYSESSYYAVIDTDNTFVLPNEEANREAAKKLASERGESEDDIFNELNSIVNSTRISVLADYTDRYSYKIIDPNKSGITSFGGLADSDLSGTYDTKIDYINNIKYEVLYGEVNDRSLIKYKQTPIKGEIVGKHTWCNSTHDINAKQIDFEESIANGLTITDEESLSLEEYKEIKDKLLAGEASQKEIDSLLLIPIDAFVPTRIVLSIYVEGWDKDNINDTMAASFICKIAFGAIDRHVTK